MDPPRVTRPMAFVLGRLRDGDRTGPELRLALAEAGLPCTHEATFYQMMTQLARLGCVISRRESVMARSIASRRPGHEGHSGRRSTRIYALTDEGRATWEANRDLDPEG